MKRRTLIDVASKNDVETLEVVMGTKFDAPDQKIETAKNQVLFRGATALLTCTGILLGGMKIFSG